MDEQDLLERAKNGDVGAQRSLALLYELGIDREADPVKAFELWLKVAHSADPVAQLTVADMYEKGEGTEKDLEKAAYWRDKAAASNYFPWDSNERRPYTPSETQPKVLIVDDDESIQDLLATRCRLQHLEPVLASSADEAFTKMKDCPDTSVILLDLAMPGVSGLQLLKTIRKMQIMEGVPVIVVSGKVVGKTVRELTRLGINGLFTKPIDLPRLFEKIEGLLQGSP